MGSVSHLPLAISKFRRIVKDNKADIVHTHLVWPTVVARLSVPRNIPLLTTIHTSVATAPDYKKWYIRMIERYTYKYRKSTIIGVAKGVLDQYFSFLNLKPYKTYVLYTFVDVERFRNPASPDPEKETFEVISTGSFRIAKNFPFLINAFRALKDEDIVLHIYGTGPLEKPLQKMIDENGVKVVLKGEVGNIQDILPRYDAYVMSSAYEGFSLAVLEAMAVKLPLLVSNIPSFREQLEETALFFNLDNEKEFTDKLLWIKNNRRASLQLAERSYNRAIENFTFRHHIKKLHQIYADALSGR